MKPLIKVTQFTREKEIPSLHSPFYYAILFEGEATFTLDFHTYTCSGKNILFLSPYQILNWNTLQMEEMYYLQFHGDFYCIEYHNEEVACNGILFNAPFEVPFVVLQNKVYDELVQYCSKISLLDQAETSYDISLVKTYLQLILALSSKEKQISNAIQKVKITAIGEVANFKELLEEYIVHYKSVSFYADKYNLSTDVFSKKIKKYFGKTPTQLIQERLVLEAKKQLHLTHKSIKGLASELGFSDEFYFSRYFKKEVGVSPKVFREQVGISIVAKKSME
ncbi:helix-turn-helix transcriptional regulator [Myroides sp. M-43]|uniref:helix-turn-helix domain-containing protein n=1 Tax=Myroides oncorhynchi TaxID=2893756 RepID=UPI001E5CFA9E|nr:response regulator transcription factor [Myroides oncorhynchi]MCC9044269.1 helix-turn-helix transcriptional regulator [Myroides oncorhynchi]